MYDSGTCVRVGGVPRGPSRQRLTHVSFLLQTLKNSKSLGSLDCEGEDEDEARAKTAVSSPRAPHGLTGLVTPASSPLGACPRPRPASPSLWASQEGGSGGDSGDWDSAGEDGVSPLGPGELDLEQIENN